MTEMNGRLGSVIKVKTKLDINIIVVQIMWLFLLMRITVINQNIWRTIEFISFVLCLVYVLNNIKYVRLNAILLVVLFSSSYLISSLINREANGLYVTYIGILFACKTFIFFTVPWISVRKRGSKKVAQASLNCLLLYWIPAVITVFVQGKDVVDNANNVYFIGNKFQIAYLNIVLLCLLLFLNRNQIEKYSNHLVLRMNKKKIGIFLFYVAIIYVDYFMKAYTGLFMILFILLLAMLSNILQFRVNKKWNGFLRFIQKPVIMVGAVLLSGFATILLETVMNIPLIASYLTSIGKTGNILSRTLIYKNLIDIISKKRWMGYGYGSSIVSKYFGPNAQNGLAQVTIYTGILGVTVMLITIFYCCKRGGQNKSSTIVAFLYAIYAFILSATVEVTYSGFFFVLLAFYCACGWEDRK